MSDSTPTDSTPDPIPDLSNDFFLIFAPADRAVAERLHEALRERTPGRVAPDIQATPVGADLASAFLPSLRDSRFVVVLVTANCDASMVGRRDLMLAIELAAASASPSGGRRRVLPVLVDVTREHMALFGGADLVSKLDEPLLAKGGDKLVIAAKQLLERLAMGWQKPPRPSLAQVEELEKLLVGKQRQRHRDTVVAAMVPRLTELAQAIARGAQSRAGDLVAGARMVKAIAVDSFSTTWYARREDNGELCITKEFRFDRLQQGTSLWGFRRAIRALRLLNDAAENAPRSIVKLLAVSDDTLAFSTEFVPDGTLEHVASRGWNAQQKRELFAEVCGAVSFAHRVGVVHGDIKPASILLGAELHAVLTDFALPAPQDAAGSPQAHAAAAMDAFLAPELRDPTTSTHAGEATESSDIYSLGRVLHYLLIERSPGPPSDAGQRPENLSRFPPAVVQVVVRATQIDPAQRYASVADMLADLGSTAWDPGRSQPSIEAVRAAVPAAASRAASPSSSAPPQSGIQLGAGAAPRRRNLFVGAALMVALMASALVYAVAMRDVDTSRLPPRSKMRPVVAALPGAPECKPNPVHCQWEEITDVNGVVFMRVCPGDLCMGSAPGDSDAKRDEMPAHTVKIPEFRIAKYEVSNKEYRALDPRHVGEDDLPATGVSWDDAKRYCEINRYRLPTEAEWEYAARGSEGRKFPWGDATPMPGQAAFAAGSLSSAVPVRSFADAPGPFGTVNQAGNVDEWVADCYRPDSYARLVENKVEVPAMVDEPGCHLRVVRGGSFRSVARNLRSALRGSNDASARIDSIGFRCAR